MRRTPPTQDRAPEELHLAPGPLHGVKLAQVVLGDDDSLRFGGLALGSVHNAYYDASDQASCSKGMVHRVPAWGCTCGFHVAFDLAGLEAMYPDQMRRREHALLEVLVWGQIVEHERGMRAKHQSVRSVSYAARCTWCEGDANAFSTTVPRGALVISLVPACDRCHARKSLGKRRFEVEELTAGLEVPVQLRDEPPRVRSGALRGLRKH